MIALAVIAGLLLWSGFAPIENPVGPFLGVLLLFRILLDRGVRARFQLVFIVALAFFSPLLHWSSTYVGATPWLILSIGQSLIFSILAFIPLKRDLASALVFGLTITAIEILRMKAPFGGFGWGRIGHTQTEILGDFYPVVGVAGVTFMAAVLAASLTLFPIRTISFAVLLFILGSFVPSYTPSKKINVIAVQGGVDKLGLEFNDRAFSVLRRHADITNVIENESDLIIWPENASDVDPIRNAEAKKLVQEAAQRSGTNLLVGAVLQGESGPSNASILYNEAGNVASIYLKQDLAPFGEYIPLRYMSEFIAPQARAVRDFQAGREWKWHSVSGVSFVSLICFEVLDDDFVRSGMKEAEFAVAQTNNATFGRSSQAQQQLQIIRARAAELGRDFAVVSTTGFTGQVNRHGELVSKLEQFEPGTLAMEIDTYRTSTLASHIGSWLWLALLVGALAIRFRSIFTR